LPDVDLPRTHGQAIKSRNAATNDLNEVMVHLT
jgi:hypothetical protein